MCENDSFTKVSIVRKLLEKKIDKVHETLNERLKVLSEELGDFEKDFETETKKDETELNKLTQYRLNTIELFDEGDYQLMKVESRIELLHKRIEQRKVKLEFDDVLINTQIASLGQLFRMEEVSGGGYEVFGSISEGLGVEHYEEIDEVLMEERDKMNASNMPVSVSLSKSSYQGEKIIYEVAQDEYLTPKQIDPRKPLRQAPIPPGKPRPPPPPPVRTMSPVPLSPVPLSNVPLSHVSLSPVPLSPIALSLPALSLPAASNLLMSPLKRWRAKTNDDSEGEDRKQEEELYNKVPEKGFFTRKKSTSMSNKLDQTGLVGQIDFEVISKCRIGAGPGQILKPKNIAISQKTGCIFVVEKGNNRVQVFAATGEPVYSFTRKTVIPNHSMVKPYGICILSEKVFVSVTQYNCVQAYRSNGEFIMQKGQEGKGEGNFVFPTGMSTDGTNRIYVCDYGNNRVQVFSKELQFKQVIGVGHLTNPTDIAVDQQLDLYVLDRATTIVHIFNSKGVYQKKIIKIVKYPILSNPQFIAISPKGRIVLSDLLSSSVNIFTMDGGLRQTLGGPRDKELFGEPRGVAFDRNGNLVVACHKETGCLQIIDIDV